MTNDNNCVICFEILCSSHSQIGVINPCGHVFHKECYSKWENEQRKRHKCLGHRDYSELKVKCPTCNTKAKGFIGMYLNLESLIVGDNDDESDDSDDNDDDDDSDDNDNHNNINEKIKKRKKKMLLKEKIKILKRQNKSFKESVQQYNQLQQELKSIHHEKEEIESRLESKDIMIKAMKGSMDILELKVRGKEKQIESIQRTNIDLNEKLKKKDDYYKSKLKEATARGMNEFHQLSDNYKKCTEEKDEWMVRCKEKEKEIATLQREREMYLKNIGMDYNTQIANMKRQNYDFHEAKASNRVMSRKKTKRMIADTMGEFENKAAQEAQEQRLQQQKMLHRITISKSSEQAKKIRKASMMTNKTSGLPKQRKSARELLMPSSHSQQVQRPSLLSATTTRISSQGPISTSRIKSNGPSQGSSDIRTFF